MFDEDTLQSIFSSEEVRQVPLVYQSIMVHAIEAVLDGKEGKDIQQEVYSDIASESADRG